MTSQRPPQAPSDLAAQLRATAHEPDDDVASALRARLRHKMFGRGQRPAPSAPLDAADPQVESPSSLLLGWSVPTVAVVALVGMSLWLYRARTEETPAPAPEEPAVLRAHVSAPQAEAEAPLEPDPGPGLLEAAALEPDLARRSFATSAAVRAAWAEPSAPRRLEATVGLADQLRGEGEPLRALEVVRAVLDDLELQPHAKPARAVLLESLARAYEDLGREPAATAARAEARRLTPSDGAR
ncbi:MAG: hypothetical protein ACRBN8_26220 [Nannocystales bacterium]